MISIHTTKKDEVYTCTVNSMLAKRPPTIPSQPQGPLPSHASNRTPYHYMLATGSPTIPSQQQDPSTIPSKAQDTLLPLHAPYHPMLVIESQDAPTSTCFLPPHASHRTPLLSCASHKIPFLFHASQKIPLPFHASDRTPYHPMPATESPYHYMLVTGSSYHSMPATRFP